MQPYNPIYHYLINLMVFKSWEKFTFKVKKKFLKIKQDISSSESENILNELFSDRLNNEISDEIKKEKNFIDLSNCLKSTSILEQNVTGRNELEINIKNINDYNFIKNGSKKLNFGGKKKKNCQLNSIIC